MEVKEVGGRCDMVFTCDTCDQYEYPEDADGEVGYVRMYEVNKKIVCEYCLATMQKKNGPGV